MSWAIIEYYQSLKGVFLIPLHIVFLASACMTDYHLVTYPASYRSGMCYTTFSMIATEADDPQNLTLDSISKGLAIDLQTLGLKKDSLKPELLFIIRWETHLTGHYSSAANKTMLQAYSSTGSKFRHHDKESFYRIQAIDAMKSELAWSIKIYPHKTKGLRPESIPQIIRELIRSFSQVQMNHLKSENHEYDDNKSFGQERTL